jgi:hypothetical protein
MQKTKVHLAAISLLAIGFFASGFSAVAQARVSSTSIELPGVKVQKRNGWFGRQSTVYQDALGNRVNTRRGWFGTQKTQAQVFGTQVEQNTGLFGGGASVKDAQGNPLASRRVGIFSDHTHINGNAMWQGLQQMLQPVSPPVFRPVSPSLPTTGNDDEQ